MDVLWTDNCLPLPFAADEEKLDERAKMSVAAKRSLFRVQYLPCV